MFPLQVQVVCNLPHSFHASGNILDVKPNLAAFASEALAFGEVAMAHAANVTGLRVVQAKYAQEPEVVHGEWLGELGLWFCEEAAKPAIDSLFFESTVAFVAGPRQVCFLKPISPVSKKLRKPRFEQSNSLSGIPVDH